MPVTGYNAPVVQGLGQGAPGLPSGAAYNNGQPTMNGIPVPMEFGFPQWNQAYNIYGNSNAAAARYGQIGQTPPSSGGVQVPTIPGLTTTAGSGTTGTGLPMLPPASSATSGGVSNFEVPGSTQTGSATGVGGYSPGAAPNLGSLTQMINQLNLQGQQAANQGRIPGEAGLETQSSQNIGQELAGQLPADVITQLQQQAAERGIATGSPGSDNSNAAYLRALGLNSLQEQQVGQENLSAATARNPGARVFDPTSQLLTPAQAGQLNLENAGLQLDWFKALNALNNRGGGGGGGGQPTTQDSGTTPTNWFNNLMGGTSTSTAAPTGGAQGFTQDPNYPGTDIPGLPGLTGILGTADPGYGLSPSQFGQGTYGVDASSPGYWDFTGGGGYDPFSQL